MTSAAMTGKPSERFWVPGDWNAFFGFGTNILVNLLTLSGLLRFVLKMPDEIVFKHILPAARRGALAAAVPRCRATSSARCSTCGRIKRIITPHSTIAITIACAH